MTEYFVGELDDEHLKTTLGNQKLFLRDEKRRAETDQWSSLLHPLLIHLARERADMAFD